MSCEDLIADRWELMVEYANTNGNITEESLDRAESDYSDGIITSDDLLDLGEAESRDCALEDAVDVSELELDVSGQEITATANVSTPGSSSVYVEVEFLVDGSNQVVEGDTISSTGQITTTYDVGEGEYEVCADIWVVVLP